MVCIAYVSHRDASDATTGDQFVRGMKASLERLAKREWATRMAKPYDQSSILFGLCEYCRIGELLRIFRLSAPRESTLFSTHENRGHVYFNRLKDTSKTNNK